MSLLHPSDGTNTNTFASLFKPKSAADGHCVCTTGAFAFNALTLLREVHTESVTPELGYMYAITSGDAVLPVDRKDLHFEYAYTHAKSIQLCTATNVMNLIQMLARPLIDVDYTTSNKMSIMLPPDYCVMLDNLSKQIEPTDSEFMTMNLMVRAALDNVTTDDLNMVNQTRHECVSLKHVLDIMVPYLELRTYDFTISDDYTAFMSYTSCQKLPKVLDILECIYRLFVPAFVDLLKMHDNEYHSARHWLLEPQQLQWINSVPCKSPEYICGITNYMDFSNIAPLQKERETNTTVLNYLSSVYGMDSTLRLSL